MTENKAPIIVVDDKTPIIISLELIDSEISSKKDSEPVLWSMTPNYADYKNKPLSEIISVLSGYPPENATEKDRNKMQELVKQPGKYAYFISDRLASITSRLSDNSEYIKCYRAKIADREYNALVARIEAGRISSAKNCDIPESSASHKA